MQASSSYGKKSGRSLLIGLIGLVIGLVMGGLVAFFVFGGAGGAPRPVAGSLQESQLDTVVGAYRYNNQEYQLTAREAILASKSLDAVRNADGTYQTPTTDMVVSAARNAILAQLVKDNGVEVSGDEVLAYARETVGTDNMTAVAAYFDMDEDQARQIMGEAAAVKKLRETVIGTGADAPVPPDYPADGNTEVGNAAYADYILGLIGSNWDTTTQSWANTSNPYYTALQDKVFAPGSANYEAAQAAYAVAYDLYTSSGSGDSSVRSSWTAWLNQYLDAGSIAVATLRA